MNAHHRGETNDVVAYLTAEAKFFGILKCEHKSANPLPLIFIPTLLTDTSKP